MKLHQIHWILHSKGLSDTVFLEERSQRQILLQNHFKGAQNVIWSFHYHKSADRCGPFSRPIGAPRCSCSPGRLVLEVKIGKQQLHVYLTVELVLFFRNYAFGKNLLKKHSWGNYNNFSEFIGWTFKSIESEWNTYCVVRFILTTYDLRTDFKLDCKGAKRKYYEILVWNGT